MGNFLNPEFKKICQGLFEEMRFEAFLHHKAQNPLHGNGLLPYLQMGVAVTGFVEDFRYGLRNS